MHHDDRNSIKNSKEKVKTNPILILLCFYTVHVHADCSEIDNNLLIVSGKFIHRQ